MERTQETERRHGVNKCSNKDFISVTLLVTVWPITKVVRDLFKSFHWDHTFRYRTIVRAPTKNSSLPFPEWRTAKSSRRSPLFQPANFAGSRRLATTLQRLFSKRRFLQEVSTNILITTKYSFKCKCALIGSYKINKMTYKINKLTYIELLVDLWGQQRCHSVRRISKIPSQNLPA